MYIFMKTATLLFLMLVLHICSEEVNETIPTLSKQTEVCLGNYEKYVQLLKEIYSEQIQKMKRQQIQVFLDRKVIEIVKKCHKLASYQVQNYEQTISMQTAASLDKYLMLPPQIQFSVAQQKSICQQIKIKKTVIESKYVDGILLFGYNLKKLPKSFKYYYLAVYAVIAIGALIYGLKNIENKQQLIKAD